jgi:hypothetical protein
MSLDPEYPSWKAMEIIKHVVSSSGNQLRQKVLEEMIELHQRGQNPVTNRELAEYLRVGAKACLIQASILWNLKILSRELLYDSYGKPMQIEWSIEKKWEDRLKL